MGWILEREKNNLRGLIKDLNPGLFLDIGTLITMEDLTL